jgi:hypothetical protein
MASKATQDIVSLGVQFMGISDPLPFSESRMASFIVAMLPDEVVSDADIKEACATIGNTYTYVDAYKLYSEIASRIYARSSTASSAILVVGLVLVVMLFFRK